MTSAPDSGTGPVVARLPGWLWSVPYVGARFPGSPAVAERPDLAEGANCQLFAYAVLRHFGLEPPALRSSDLWADTAATTRVTRARPLDLLLFNATDDAYGAHVGVWTAPDRVLHLCAEAGRPAVWPLAAFAARPRYRTLIGVKRVTAPASLHGMTQDPFVPGDFAVPDGLSGDGFRLEPLGPRHNASDHAAWTSSIDHIRATPDFRGRGWPPPGGMSPEQNLDDLRRHADDFEKRTGFTYTVLDDGDQVIGCVYIYPSPADRRIARVRSWVRADREELDGPLAEAVTAWLASHWPFGEVHYR